jgi:Zn-dependent peptidase ImmA (M78 family)
MSGKPSPITPSVLAWAIAEDGREPVEIAEALKIDEAVLDEWAEGESQPTVGQVTDLGKTLKRPRAMFFMPQPLISASLPPSFRHPPGDDRQVSATARRKVRQARQVQTVIAEALADRDPLDVPRFVLATPADEAAAAARRWLGVNDAAQASWRNDHEALNAWRAALDYRGIFVFALEIGDPAQRKTPRTIQSVSDEVRGFSAWDDRAPLIVMNSRRVSAAARCFTLGHELGHLVARVDAACIDTQVDAQFGEPIERWCEEFGAALLMPEEPTRLFARARGLTDDSGDIEDVKALMNAFRVSGRAAALRLIDLGLAPRSLYRTVVAMFRPKPTVEGRTIGWSPPRSQMRLRQFGPRALDAVFRDVEPFEALSILRMTVPDARELSGQVPSAAVL